MKTIIPRVIFVGLLLVAVYLAYNQFSDTGNSNTVFVPYKNSQLTEGTLSVSPELRRYSEDRIASFQKTINSFTETTPTNDKVNMYFALAAEQQLVGRYTDAKKSLEAALALKNDAHIVHAYASLLYQMGAGADALEYIDDAIRIAPSVTNFWRTKISFVSTLYPNKPSKIESTYKDGIKATNGDIDLITLYASYLGSHDQKDEAIKYWQQAIEKNPVAKSVYESEIANLR